MTDDITVSLAVNLAASGLMKFYGNPNSSGGEENCARQGSLRTVCMWSPAPTPVLGDVTTTIETYRLTTTDTEGQMPVPLMGTYVLFIDPGTNEPVGAT